MRHNQGRQVFPTLVRLHADGSLDEDFLRRWLLEEVQLGVLAIAPQPDGRAYVAGGPRGGGSTPDNGRLLRLNLDGSLDRSFMHQAFPGPVNALAVQPDGKIIAAGSTGTRRFNPDGSPDRTYFHFIPQAEDFTVKTVTLQPDGRIIAGGGGYTPGNIQRLLANGREDPSFVTPEWGISDVRSVLLQPDGNILVAGYRTRLPDYVPIGPVWRLLGDAGPQGIEFTQTAYVAYETDGWVDIGVRRSAPLSEPTMVHYRIMPGTASPGRDYFGGGGTLLFRRGESLKTIRLFIRQDEVADDFETLQLLLIRANGGELGHQRLATLTLLDQ